MVRSPSTEEEDYFQTSDIYHSPETSPKKVNNSLVPERVEPKVKKPSEPVKLFEDSDDDDQDLFRTMSTKTNPDSKAVATSSGAVNNLFNDLDVDPPQVPSTSGSRPKSISKSSSKALFDDENDDNDDDDDDLFGGRRAPAKSTNTTKVSPPPPPPPPSFTPSQAQPQPKQETLKKANLFPEDDDGGQLFPNEIGTKTKTDAISKPSVKINSKHRLFDDDDEDDDDDDLFSSPVSRPKASTSTGREGNGTQQASDKSKTSQPLFDPLSDLIE
jgi:hypothetical protein